jgi:hypothetical protein
VNITCARRETLRYAVSRAMFCRRCEMILDVRRAVLVEFHPSVDAPPDAQSVFRCVCWKCWNHVASAFDGWDRVTVLSGPVLFASREPSPKRVGRLRELSADRWTPAVLADAPLFNRGLVFLAKNGDTEVVRLTPDGSALAALP